MRARPCLNLLMAIRHYILLLLIFLSILRNGAPNHDTDVGPIRLPFLKVGRCYQWQASLDSSSGRATSKELSQSSWMQNRETKRATKKSVRRASQKFLERYPQWLAQGRVTFGLLRAVTSDADEMNNEQVTSIKPRFFNINLLSFGKLKVVKQRTFGRRHFHEFELPITSGILTLSSPQPKKDRGCLKFSVVAKPLSPSSAKGKRRKKTMSCHLQSEISGNYCPKLAGPAPVSFLRKWGYLSTQSLVHAHVMWKLHRTWNSRVNKIC